MKKIKPFLQASNSGNNIHQKKFDTGHKSGTVVVLEMLKNIKVFNQSKLMTIVVHRNMIIVTLLSNGYQKVDSIVTLLSIGQQKVGSIVALLSIGYQNVDSFVTLVYIGYQKVDSIVTLLSIGYYRVGSK